MNNEKDIDLESLYGYEMENKVKVYESEMRRNIGEILMNMDGDKDFEVVAVDTMDAAGQAGPDNKWDIISIFDNETHQIKYEQFSFLKDK